MPASLERVQARFAQRIRERRAVLGLTQESVAEAAGLSPRHYQKLEAAELNMTLETMCRVADALSCEVRDLLFSASFSLPRSPLLRAVLK